MAFESNKKHGGLVLALACALIVLMLSRPSLPQVQRSSDSSVRRRASLALPGGGCRLTKPVEAKTYIEPSFLVSYPGSGSEMTSMLIRGLTGLVTGAAWQMDGNNLDMVTIKTHFPHYSGTDVAWSARIGRAIILLRNPMNALPSLFNFMYEMENNLENHSTHAPPNAWIEWRDANFQKEFDLWVGMVEYWMESTSVRERLVVQYEDITHGERGPISAERIAEFLDESEGVKTVAKVAIPCVWKKVVHYDDPNVESEWFKGKTKRTSWERRTYTTEQMDYMVTSLVGLAQRYSSESSLVYTLNRYAAFISLTSSSQQEEEARRVSILDSANSGA